MTISLTSYSKPGGKGALSVEPIFKSELGIVLGDLTCGSTRASNKPTRAMQYSAVQCKAENYSKEQYSTEQPSTAQYSAQQYSTEQYSTEQCIRCSQRRRRPRIADAQDHYTERRRTRELWRIGSCTDGRNSYSPDAVPTRHAAFARGGSLDV